MTTLEKAKGALANKYGHEWTEDEHEVAQALLDAVDLMKDINEQLTYIVKNGKRKNIGFFTTLEGARNARLNEEKTMPEYQVS